MIKSMLIAGAGGFVGTCARYLTGRLCAAWWCGLFPLGTFTVNLLGCFVIGLVVGFLEKTNLLTPNHSLLLVTGFCGGFTTFSAFANEIYTLASRQAYVTAAIYLILSIVLGIALVALGRSIPR